MGTCRGDDDQAQQRTGRFAQQRRERGGRLGAGGIDPAQAPCCADQLDMSFHLYSRIRAILRVRANARFAAAVKLP